MLVITWLADVIVDINAAQLFQWLRVGQRFARR